MARDSNLDLAGFVAEFAADDGAIDFCGATFFELGGEIQMGFVRFRDDDAAARVHVESVDNARPRYAGDAAKLAFAMMQERIDQSAAVMARGWMHNEAGRFVERDDVFVFIQDVQRDFFGLGAR
jgi:hypothetical protein